MGKRRIWTQEQTQEIVNLYKRGLSMREIGTKYAAKGETISKVLKEQNIIINRTKINRELNHRYFEFINSETKAYLLGFLMADGSVNYRNRSEKDPEGVVSIELSEKDIEILELFRTEINSHSAFYYRKDKLKQTVSFKVNSTAMAKDLEKYNLIPNKTYLLEKVIPKELPKEYQIDFLRGLFDGDGSIYKVEKKYFGINFTGFSKEYVEDFQRIIDELIEKETHSSVTKASAYRAVWNGTQNCKKIVNVLYKDSKIYLSRKYNLALEILRG